MGYVLEFVEKPPELVTKLLFKGAEWVSPQMVYFICGQAGVYVERVIILENNQALASVQYEHVSQIDAILDGAKTVKVWRVFKSGPHSPGKALSQSFVDRTLINALNLLRGMRLRIESDDRELRQRFYERAVKLNEDGGLGCSFDFDSYDVGIVIRHVSMLNGGQRFIVVHSDRSITEMLPSELVH